MSPSKPTAEEKYKSWRAEVYDKYNSIQKTDLVRSIDTLKSIMKPKKYSRVSDCKRNVECETMWNKQGYILRHIRLAILRHDWSALRRLILMLSSNEKHHCYVKEVTFLLALMAGVRDERIVDGLRQCFSTGGNTQNGSENPYDISFVDEV